jgi:hypothetical protein
VRADLNYLAITKKYVGAIEALTGTGQNCGAC